MLCVRRLQSSLPQQRCLCLCFFSPLPLVMCVRIISSRHSAGGTFTLSQRSPSRPDDTAEAQVSTGSAGVSVPASRGGRIRIWASRREAVRGFLSWRRMITPLKEEEGVYCVCDCRPVCSENRICALADLTGNRAPPVISLVLCNLRLFRQVLTENWRKTEI